MNDMSGVNLIVRAIIETQGHILLLTPTEENKEFAAGHNFFLPGGHVEHNEPAIDALKRELMEEINLAPENITSTELRGVLECSWERKGRLYHELNLVYKVEAMGLSVKQPPIAVEPFHRFLWCPLANLESYPILSEKMLPLIQEAVKVDGKISFYSQML